MRPLRLRSRANSVRCSVDFSESGPFVAGDTEDTRRWVHIATSGNYLGYRGGERPFEFTREVFDQMVANLRAHPSYRAGENGEGDYDIIPWDFEHQNDPDALNVAIEGLPAHGWSSDLKVVTTDGGCELWALTRLMEPALGYVIGKRYRQCSVDMAFDATHPVTAESVGAVLFAVALTNRPFIEGMRGLAASNLYGYYSQASSPAEAFSSLRQLFGLGALASPADLIKALQQLASYVTSATAPVGVDVDEIVGCVRQVLALPALTPAQEVLDAAGQIVQRLVAEAGPQASAANEETRMDPKKLAAMLACTATEADVESAVQELVELRKSLKTTLKLKARDGSDVLLEAANEGQAATDKLSALLKALGVEDVDAAVMRITDLMKSAADLEAVMPELAGLREAKAQAEEEVAEEEVEEAMASYKIPAECKELLLSSRKSDPKKFAEKFPKRAATPNTQLSATHKQALTGSVTAPGARRKDADPTARADGQIYLSDYPGANPTQRALAYLAATQPGFDKLSYEKKHEMAFALKRQPHVRLNAPS
jgi:hypothetical protein